MSVIVLALALTSPFIALAQQSAGRQAHRLLRGAEIRVDTERESRVEIRFPEGAQIPVSSFFEEYKKATGLSHDNDFKPYRIFTDKLGQTHHRFKQYYKGVELAEAQFLLHEKNGAVAHAHGNLTQGLDLEMKPALTEEQALQRALAHINAEAYMWQDERNESYLKKEQNDPNATYHPRGELKISSGNRVMTKENCRLVYRFDIYAEKPWGRYSVDVDAKSGEVINTISRIQHGDVRGQGVSVYNGVVPIVVNDSLTSTIVRPSHWQPHGRNAFGGSGLSWWVADSNLGNNGGYANHWYDVLDTDPIAITGSNPRLTFHHRYAVESPGGEYPGYEGWDGMNVRISTTQDTTWQILKDPTPGYSSGSLFSFGGVFGEGFGIPGWTGQSLEWTQVTFDLSAYAGQTIRLRFAFASDSAFSTSDKMPDLFGWQIDELTVSSSDGILYSNNGTASGLTPRNNDPEATLVPGKYRLRESGRGSGIVTYDARNKTSSITAIDFVDADSNFTDARARAGVSVHWSVEAAYDYFLAHHGRNSYDDAGGKIVSYAHFDNNLDNAAFDGDCLQFGDGPQNAMPVVAIDFVGHEFTHWVTRYCATLIYQGESGALNESFSDIFGTAIEFATPGVNGNWLFGEVAAPRRSMSNPKALRAPDTYLGQYWVPTSSQSDWGGIHSNCGVQNHWFYLLSEGGSGVNDNNEAYSVSGIGMEQAAQIAYRNLSVYLTPTSEYREARLGSLHSAIDLFGSNSPQYQAVKDAWRAVGVVRPYLEPAIIASADTLSFLTEVAATPDTAELTVINYGLETLRIDNLLISGTSFHLASMPGLPIDLEYEERFSLKVVFTPVAEGERAETLTIFSTDPFHPAKAIPLQGKGIAIHPASEGIIYAVTGRSANGVLLTLNPSTGTGASIGATGYSELTGVTIHPSSGELYGTIAGGASTKLVRIDAKSGAAHETVTMPVAQLRAIAFDGKADLYAARFTNGDLFRINPVTGDTTFIGETRLNLLSGLAINPVDGSLWAARASNAIYKINKATAEVTVVGNTGFSQTSEIEFDAGGKLFGITGFGANAVNELIEIDPITGKGTLIGSTGFKTVLGLAMRGAVTTEVKTFADGSLPARYELQQNYPNPFNPSTIIRYDLPKAAQVVLRIYDLAGHEIRTLVNSKQAAGRKFSHWNGQNDRGQPVSSGVYIYQLQAGDYVVSKKMLLVK